MSMKQIREASKGPTVGQANREILIIGAIVRRKIRTTLTVQATARLNCLRPGTKLSCTIRPRVVAVMMVTPF
jgi:hypothetical protein